MSKRQDSEQEERKQWDRTIKILIQANPQDIVSWLFKSAVYQGELNVELQKKAPVFADLLYTIKLRRKKVVLHIEFQRVQDNHMARRAWEYNCLASIHTGLPVYSVVIYLLKKDPIADPPYEVQWPTGLTVHRFVFENIKLWEVPGEVIKQQKLPGLLPLLPLTQDGQSREVVEDMIESLEQAGRTDLLPLAYIFSAYTFVGENEQQWLIERFHAMKGFLEDNYAYREMVKWAQEKSLQQGLQQGKKDVEHIVVRFVEFHFPALVPLAKLQAAQATTSQQLQKMFDQLLVAHTEQEARAVLLGEQQ